MRLFSIDAESNPKFNFQEFCEDLFTDLNKSKFRYALIGYFALSHHSNDFRPSRDLDILFYHKDRRKILKFFVNKYPNLTIKELDKSQYTIDLPKNDKKIETLDLLFAASEEAQDILYFNYEEILHFGATVRVPTAELLAVLICYAILFGKGEKFLNSKIEDFKFLFNNRNFDKEEFFRIVKKSYRDLLEIFNEDNTLKIKSTDTRKYYTWGEFQAIRAKQRTLKEGEVPLHVIEKRERERKARKSKK